MVSGCQAGVGSESPAGFEASEIFLKQEFIALFSSNKPAYPIIHHLTFILFSPYNFFEQIILPGFLTQLGQILAVRKILVIHQSMRISEMRFFHLQTDNFFVHKEQKTAKRAVQFSSYIGVVY